MAEFDAAIPQLVNLASRLAVAKIAEERTKRVRIAIEEEIAALVPGPEKGQKTITLPDGSKITVERGLNYKADIATIEDVFSHFEGRFAPIKTKTTRELDEKGYEYYRQNDPEGFKLLAQHVTVTPKKVSVALKLGKAG